jgi:MFS superfamily sulfate permease-like transporter
VALTIVIGQLPKLFGFSVDGDGLIEDASAFVTGLADGPTVAAALAIAVGSLILILAFQNASCPVFPACWWR